VERQFDHTMHIYTMHVCQESRTHAVIGVQVLSE
jgi:hypothetical protein